MNFRCSPSLMFRALLVPLPLALLNFSVLCFIYTHVYVRNVRTRVMFYWFFFSGTTVFFKSALLKNPKPIVWFISAVILIFALEMFICDLLLFAFYCIFLIIWLFFQLILNFQYKSSYNLPSIYAILHFVNYRLSFSLFLSWIYVPW